MIINKRMQGARIEKLPPEWIFLGAGNNGVVYSISPDKVIKIFREDEVCDKESDILLRVHGNKYFPKIIEIGENYIVREKVEGRCLRDVIKKEGMKEEIAYGLVNLLEEFKKLDFTRIDMRLKDVFINDNGELRLIDPKGYYTRHVSYPRHLCKGLMRHKGLNKFLEALFEVDPEMYDKTMKYIFRPDEDDDPGGGDGIRPFFLKKLKKKKGKTDTYNLYGPDFSTLDFIPLHQGVIDNESSVLDISEIEGLL